MSDYRFPKFFYCPRCDTLSERERHGDWVYFDCPLCGYHWEMKFKHAGGVQHTCKICGEPALKTPIAEYEDADGNVIHVPYFVGRVLCWQHGYQPTGGPVERQPDSDAQTSL